MIRFNKLNSLLAIHRQNRIKMGLIYPIKY